MTPHEIDKWISRDADFGFGPEWRDPARIQALSDIVGFDLREVEGPYWQWSRCTQWLRAAEPEDAAYFVATYELLGMSKDTIL